MQDAVTICQCRFKLSNGEVLCLHSPGVCVCVALFINRVPPNAADAGADLSADLRPRPRLSESLMRLGQALVTPR